MSTFQDAQTDSGDLAKLTNENTEVNTRYGPNPKKSFLRKQQENDAVFTSSLAGYQAQVNSELEIVKDSRGFRVVGGFAAGFTYTLPNDVGVYDDGLGNPDSITHWIYTDASALPFVVPPATIPSSPDYTQVTFNDLQGIVNLDQQSKLDEVYSRSFKSIADVRAGTDSAGSTVDFTQMNGFKINWRGYYAESDGGGNWGIVRIGDSTSLTDDGGSIFVIVNDATNGVWIEANKGFMLEINARQFGLKGNGVTDDTGQLLAFVSYVKSLSHVEGVFPSGDYLYTQTVDFAAPNSFWRGAGSGLTILRYTGTGTAVSLDAFPVQAPPAQPFINNCNFKGFSIIGGGAATLLQLRGIARGRIHDIRMNGCADTGGTDTGLGWSYGPDGTIGLYMQSVQLNDFKDVYCSYEDGDVPYRGAQMEQGNNGETAAGACSNNTFTNLYCEGNAIGHQIASNGGDNNVFISGSQESCYVWGLIIGLTCRYNTFIGVGWESLNASGGDVQTAGQYNKFLNCYSSNKFLISGSSGERIEGGFFERVEIQTDAVSTTVTDITVNNWNTGAGGFINLGIGTRTRNIYDIDLGTYIYPVADRIQIGTAGPSPYTYTNTLQKKVRVQVNGGTVTQVRILSRGGLDNREVPKPTDGFSGTFGDYELDAGDSLEVSHSVAPIIQLTEMQY